MSFVKRPRVALVPFRLPQLGSVPSLEALRQDYLRRRQRDLDWAPELVDGRLMCRSAPSFGSPAAVEHRHDRLEPRCEREAHHDGWCQGRGMRWSHPHDGQGVSK